MYLTYLTLLWHIFLSVWLVSKPLILGTNNNFEHVECWLTTPQQRLMTADSGLAKCPKQRRQLPTCNSQLAPHLMYQLCCYFLCLFTWPMHLSFSLCCCKLQLQSRRRRLLLNCVKMLISYYVICVISSRQQTVCRRRKRGSWGIVVPVPSRIIFIIVAHTHICIYLHIYSDALTQWRVLGKKVRGFPGLARPGLQLFGSWLFGLLWVWVPAFTYPHPHVHSKSEAGTETETDKHRMGRTFCAFCGKLKDIAVDNGNGNGNKTAVSHPAISFKLLPATIFFLLSPLFLFSAHTCCMPFVYLTNWIFLFIAGFSLHFSPLSLFLHLFLARMARRCLAFDSFISCQFVSVKYNCIKFVSLSKVKFWNFVTRIYMQNAKVICHGENYLNNFFSSICI